MKTSDLFTLKNGYSYVGSTFKEKILPLPYNKPRKEVLQERVLGERMTDTRIIEKFQPERVSPSEVHEYLKSAHKSSWYIFYIKGTDNLLWAVGAIWFDLGWHVGADSVSSPYEWGADYHVVSSGFSDTLTSTSESQILSTFELRLAKVENTMQAIREALNSSE